MVRAMALLALAGCLCAFVCGHAFTPRIRNATNQAVEVTVHYRDRASEHFALSPSEIRGAPASGLEIVELHVETSSGQRFTLGAEDIARMLYPLRSQFGTEVRISDSGVTVRAIEATDGTPRMSP